MARVLQKIRTPGNLPQESTQFVDSDLMARYGLAVFLFLICQIPLARPAVAEDLSSADTEAINLFRVSGDLFSRKNIRLRPKATAISCANSLTTCAGPTRK
jgi:hypothetical protein